MSSKMVAVRTLKYLPVFLHLNLFPAHLYTFEVGSNGLTISPCQRIAVKWSMQCCSVGNLEIRSIMLENSVNMAFCVDYVVKLCICLH